MIVSRSSSLKKIKKRPAEIADINDDDSLKEKTAAKCINFEGNKDHLETKKQIENLREQYGKEWLRSQGATAVHELLGIKTENMKKSFTSVEILEESGAIPPKTDDCRTSTPNKSTVAATPDGLDVSDDVSKVFRL